MKLTYTAPRAEAITLTANTLLCASTGSNAPEIKPGVEIPEEELGNVDNL